MNMEWKVLTGRHTNGKALYLNKMKVATVYWNSGRNKNDPNTHAADIKLPGMDKIYEFHVHTSEREAMDYVEQTVKRWIYAAGLEFK